MAIAYDSSSSGSGNTGTLTVSHTCSGSGRILFVGCAKDDTAISGITYAGVALTKIAVAGSGGECFSMWMLVGPASGTNDIVVSFTPTPAVYMSAASYNGVNQTGQPDAYATKSDASPTMDISLTTIADNCWAVIGGKNQGYTWSNGTGTTLRGTPGISCIGDGNSAKTPAGSYTLNVNVDGGNVVGCMVSFSPLVSPIPDRHFRVHQAVKRASRY